MVRLAGSITGSAVAIALILLILGVPEWHAPDEAPAAIIADLPQPPPDPEPATQPEPAPEPDTQTGSAPEPEPVAAPAPEPKPVAAPAPEPLATHWHSFWSPFGSRIAADGFVSRLESVTGFDYRVLKVDNGVYEVAFAYSDERERDAMLSTIASATGLDLPDS